MVELGEDLNPILQPDPVSPFSLSALSAVTGTNPVPSSEPLINTIDDFSIPSVPAAADLTDFISGGGTGAKSPFDITMDIINKPASESDIAIYKSRPYTFASGYKQSNFERYYNDKDNFYKLGFSPYANNEEIYNSNRSWYEDLGRAASAVPGLGLSFLKSIYGQDIGDEYAEANALYGSTRGGVGGFTSNLTLMLAPTLAIATDWYVTNAVLATVGTIPGLQGLAGGGVALKTASTIDKFKDLITTFSSAQKMREAFTFANTAKNLGNVLYKVTPFAETGKAIYETAKAVNQGEKLINAARVASNVGTFIRDGKKLSYAMGEANLEGDLKRNEFIDSRINEFIKDNGYYPDEQELDNIYKFGEDVKFTTSMLNMPLLYLSNAIVFDNLYKGSAKSLFKPANQVVKNFSKTGMNIVIEDGVAKLTTGLTENLKFAAKGLIKPSTYGKFSLNYFGANLSEGVQEVAQEAVSGASFDYYTDLFKNSEAAGVGLYMAAFYDNLKKQASAQGAETFLSGFLLGGLTTIGTTSLSSVSDVITNQYNKNFNKKYNDLYKKDSELAKEIVDNINLAFTDGYKIFTPDVENLLTQIKLGEDMTKAKLNFDEKAFHDLKDTARFNAVYTALVTGNFDNLINKIENMKEMTGDELKQAFNITESITPDQAKAILDVTIQRAKEIQRTYDNVKDIQNPFNPNRFNKSDLTNPEVNKQYRNEVAGYYGFEDTRRAYIFNMHSANQAAKRMSDLVSEISNIADIGKLSFIDVKNLLDIDSLDEEISNLEMELIGLEETTDPKLKKLKKAKQDKKKNLEAFKKEFLKIQELEDSDEIQKKKALKNNFSKYLRRLAEESNLTIPADKIEEAFVKLSDYYSLSKDLRRFNGNVSALADPTIFYNQTLKNINNRNSFIDNLGKYSKDILDKFLNDKKANDLVNELFENGYVINFTSISYLDGSYEQLYDFILNNPDAVFIDLNLGSTFKNDDPRFESVKDVVELFNDQFKEAPTEEAPVEEEVVVEEQPITSEEVSIAEEGVPLIITETQFNQLPLKLQAILNANLNEENSKREADGEPAVTIVNLLRRASGKKIVTDYFLDPANANDVAAYNQKKAKTKPVVPVTEETKTTPTAPAPVSAPTSVLEDAKADIEKRRQEELASVVEPISQEVFEGDSIDNEGEKVRIKIVTNSDGSRTSYIGKKGNLFGEGGGESWVSPEKISKDNTLSNEEIIKVAWSGVGENFTKKPDKSPLPTNKRKDKINERYDAELARELYKEMKAGKMVTEMTPAEQQVAYKYITPELRASVDAELAALEQPATAPVQNTLESFTDKIKNAKSIEELESIEDDITDSISVIDMIDDIQNLSLLIQSKKEQLSTKLEYSNVKVGDVLILGDNKFIFVEKILPTKITGKPLYGESLQVGADEDKKITINKKDFSKMVKGLYDSKTTEVIGETPTVKEPTSEEKDLMNTNSEEMINFLTNKEAKEAARNEATNQSQEDVNDEFLKGLGC